MPTSSRAARAFGVMSSSTSAATPALSARQRSPLSPARALKIASAIGLRQTFAVHTKRICLVRFSVALPSLTYCPLLVSSSHARSSVLCSVLVHLHYTDHNLLQRSPAALVGSFEQRPTHQLLLMSGSAFSFLTPDRPGLQSFHCYTYKARKGKTVTSEKQIQANKR